MKLLRVGCVIGLLSIVLGGCAATDLQLEPRADTINQETDFAHNNEILLNIVRASKSQPLNFVPISKASGMQSTDLKIGLPTLTLGPAQTAMQRQVAFGSNTWENSANSSFDSAPLVTHDFYSNMLSPIDLQTVNALIRQGFSRELVFNAVIGSIRVKDATGHVIEITNDPLLDPAEPACPSAKEFYRDRTINQSPYSFSRLRDSPELEPCKFHKFEFLLQAAMAWGFNVETTSDPNPAYTADAVKQAKAAGKDPPAKTITQSRFCFDPAFAERSQQNLVLKRLPDYCGAPKKAKAKSSEGQDLVVYFESDGKQSPPFTFTIIPRSPFAIFRYFGHVLRAEDTTPVLLYWHDGIVTASDERILAISRLPTSFCFAKTLYFGAFYCVPYEGGDASKQVFALLSQIVSLSTTSGSLPTTLDVRLQ